MKKPFAVFILVFTLATSALFLVVSCNNEAQNEPKSPENSFTVATWNVKNLFNAVDDGTEYSEYKSSSGWNDKAYRARLDNVKTVFSYFYADVAVLNEIENENVLTDVADKLEDFNYYTAAGVPGEAIKIGIISKVPIKSTHVHAVKGARPALEAELETPNGIVHLIAVHAKSKRGDSDGETAELRKALGRVLADVTAEHAGELVIIAGDFNEDLRENNIFATVDAETKTERKKQLSAKANAEVGTDADMEVDDSAEAGTGAKVGKIGSLQKSATSKTKQIAGEENPNNNPLKVSSIAGDGIWYNSYLDENIDFNSEGSYWYNGSWSRIDNILVSESDKWKIAESNIVFCGILKNPQGHPNDFNRNLLTGVSDHLPVFVRLEY